jgi:hypothetical protein
LNKLRLTGLLLTRLLGLLLMYVSCVQVGYAQQSGGGNYPTGNGVRVREVDGSPNVPGTQTLVFPNGSLTRAGQTVTVTIAGGTTINSTNGQVPYRVNSTTFGDSAFASNALNSTYLSATSGASGAGLTLTVAGGGSSENLILTPKGANGQLTVSNTSNTAGPMFTLTNSYGSAVLSVGGGGGLSISTALTTNGGTLTVTSSGGNPVQFITAGSNIARLGNGSAAIQLLLGTSTDTADAQLSVYSQSTTRPGLKLNMPSGTSATQEAFGVYNNGTLTTRIDTDGDITSSKAGWEIIGATGSSVTVGASNGVTYLGSTAAFGGSMVVSDARVAVKNTIPIGWSSDTTSYGTVDVALYRDAANTLAQRNGVNAQTFRVYNTYTSGSNYERLGIQASSNAFFITPEAATGTVRELVAGAAGSVTRIRSSLATPSAPALADGDWWVECSGTSPARTCSILVRDTGATRTIATSAAF